MKQTLGQKFDAAIRTHSQSMSEAMDLALYLIASNLRSYSDRPENDFNPQFKTRSDEIRLPDYTAPNTHNINYLRDRANETLLASAEGLKQIAFLSLERKGVTHDFPIRATFKPVSALAAAFRKQPPFQPVIMITGIDGKERAFVSRAYRDSLRSIKNDGFADKAAAFMVSELQKKALLTRKPAVNAAPVA